MMAGVPCVRISLFAALEVEVGGVDVTDRLPGRQGRAVVAHLALAYPRPVTRAELFDVLWPAHPPGSPETALSSVLAKVRRTVGQGVITGREHLSLQLGSPEAVDAHQVKAGVEAAERALADGRFAEAFAAADRACSVLAQPLLPGMHAQWAEDWRAEYAELESRALETAARAGIELGGTRLAAALAAAGRLVEQHPFREGGHALMMQAQARRGDAAEALQTFERLRVLLREELGATPTPRLVKLHERLLRHGPDIAEPAAAAPRAPPPPPRPAALAPVDGAFVGRRAPLERLDSRWAEVCAGHTRLVLLVGEPGIGKTRLAMHFAEHVQAGGGVALYGRADEETLIPHQPFVEALRSLQRRDHEAVAEAAAREHGLLGRLLPDLGPPGGEPPGAAAWDGDTLRFRLFEAVARLLGEVSRRAPMLLILDDLHWADRPTLLLLRHLLRQPDLSRLLVIGAFRHVELGFDHPLVDLLADLRREQRYDRVMLDGLDEDDTRALIADRLGVEATPGFVGRLCRQTDGNAFFIEETLRALADSDVPAGARATEQALELLGVPDGVAEVIRRRGRRLSPMAAESLTAAAVVGRDFDMDVVAGLVDAAPEEVMCALEESLAAGLILEHGERVDAFVFCHSLVRDVLYGQLPAIRRVRVHQRVAETLEALAATRAVSAAERAHHCWLARQLTGPEPARRYTIAAAEEAARQLAYEEAIGHYRRALEVVEDEEARCELLLALGRVQWHAGDDEARSTFLSAADSALRRGAAPQLARAALGFGERYWEAAYLGVRHRSLLEQALAAIGPSDGRLRALLLTRLAVNLAFATEHQRASDMSAEALAMARRLGDDDVLVAALLARHVTQLDVRHLAERLRIGSELVQVPGVHRELAAEIHQWRLYDFVEANRLAAAREEQEQLDRLAQDLRQPLFRSIAAGWRGVWAELEGDLALAEHYADVCLREGQRAHAQDALSTWAAKLFMLRRRQGRLRELAGIVERLGHGRARRSGWAAALALLRAETGRPEDARKVYDELLAQVPDGLPRGIYWLTTVVLLAETCVALGGVPGAATLYRALEPYADRNVVVGYSSCWGPVHGWLALLATVTGDPQHANVLLRRALARTRAMPAPLLTADLERRCSGLAVE